ncbi:MAG TPA: hypothetical protein VK825_02080 [Xanthobacteraceae bacterium]|jgi:hypothetical protein|nr:hypothetical protein [Xanthobacteraceae bacterium]
MPGSELQNAPRRPRLEFPGSRRSFQWVIAAIGLCIFGGLYELKTNPILALCGLALMSAALWACLRSMRPGATYLALDPEGLTYSVRFVKQVIKWTDIKAIRIGWLGVEPVEIPWNRQVFIDCSNRSDAVQIFPPMFSLNAEQLVDLMKPYHEDATRIGKPQNVAAMLATAS